MAPLDTRNRSLILYAVRLDYLDKLLKKDQRQLVEDNPQANKKVPVFYVGQTTLLAWQRYENHRNGHRDSKWVRKYVQHLIRVDEWEQDFGVALPKKPSRPHGSWPGAARPISLSARLQSPSYSGRRVTTSYRTEGRLPTLRGGAVVISQAALPFALQARVRSWAMR